MSKDLVIWVSGRRSSGKPTEVAYEMDMREFMTHIKQMLNSISQRGFVHQIEDHENPFNDIAIDNIEICRAEDWEDDDDEWDGGEEG